MREVRCRLRQSGRHPAVQVYKYFDAAKKALADWMDLSSLKLLFQ